MKNLLFATISIMKLSISTEVLQMSKQSNGDCELRIEFVNGKFKICTNAVEFYI